MSPGFAFLSLHLKTSWCLEATSCLVPALPLTLCSSAQAQLPEFAQSALLCWFWVLFPALPLEMNTGSVPLPGVSPGGCESSSLLPAGHFSPPGSLLNKANKPQLFPAQGEPCLQRIPKPAFRGLGFFGWTAEPAPFLGGLRGRWWSFQGQLLSPAFPKSLFLPRLFPRIKPPLALLIIFFPGLC